MYEEVCNRCSGSGFLYLDEICPDCSGEGVIYVEFDEDDEEYPDHDDVCFLCGDEDVIQYYPPLCVRCLEASGDTPILPNDNSQNLK